jgi:hypothetical protein
MKHIYFISLFFLFALMANAQGVLLQNFETITNPKGAFFVDNSSFAPVSLADNPLIYGINKSAKVAAVEVSPGGSTNSGILKISFTAGADPVIQYPANPLGLDLLYFDVLRFKYYAPGALNKNVEFEPNGAPTSPKTIVQPNGNYYEEWAYVTIPLVNKTYTNFQIRVNRNADGSGSAAGTATGSLVYIDDFEMYNSTDGPYSAIKLVPKVETDFSCVTLQNRNFCVKASLDKKSDVRIELIFIDGRSQTIFQQTATGNIEVPFSVNQKGIYCVRMTLDNSQSEVIKILAK